MKKFLLVAVLLIFPALPSQAGPRFFKVTQSNPITTNTSVYASPSGNKPLLFQFNYIAGTGTITYTCSLTNDLTVAYVAPTGAPATVTGSGMSVVLSFCKTYKLTMSSCSSCNVDIYAADLSD